MVMMDSFEGDGWPTADRGMSFPSMSGLLVGDPAFLRGEQSGSRALPYDGLFVNLRVGREERLRSGALTAPSSVARSC
jgi:hypothetical protein